MSERIKHSWVKELYEFLRFLCPDKLFYILYPSTSNKVNTPVSAKRHHYVPEFYLSYFLSKGEKTLWVYDKQKSGEPRPQQPKDTAVIGQYYTFETPSGQKENLEEGFSQIEGLAQPILKRWQEPKAIPEVQEIEVMAAFLAFLCTRGPRAVRMTTELEIATLVDFCREVTKDPAEVKKCGRGL